MKKIISAALIAAALATGVAFAQEAEEEPSASFKVSGVAVSGLTANFNEKTLSWYNNDYTDSRVRLNMSYSYGDVGVKARVELRESAGAAESGVKVSYSAEDGVTVSGTKITVPYVYGYASLFDGLVDVSAGSLYINPFGPNNIGYGMYGKGVSVSVNPVDFLSVGVNVYADTYGSVDAATLDSNFALANVQYGAAFNTDMVSGTVAFGADGYTGAAGAILTSVSVSPIEALSIYAETDIYDLLDSEAATEVTGAYTFGFSGVDKLYAEVTVYEDAYIADEVENYTYVGFYGSYDVLDDLSADLTVAYNTDGGYAVRPGVTYVLGNKCTLGAHYIYNNGENFDWYTTGLANGNELQLDFSFGF